MKKKSRLKTILILLGVVVGISAIGLFVVYPAWRQLKTRDEADANEPKIAKEYDNIDFNKDNGLLYVNNEIIIMSYEGVTREEMETFVNEQRAEIVAAMEDIGFWQIQYRSEMTYDELVKALKKIKNSELVEDAYINTVYEPESDSLSQDTELTAQPVFPNDPWNDDAKSWDMKVPRGSNWGMEAIQAPAAWGYLEYLNEVNIGLIDSMVDINHEDINMKASYITYTGEYSFTEDASWISPDDHGTHVSGIMAGGFNNEIGVSGVMGDKGNLYYSCAFTVKDNTIISDYYTAYNYLMALKALIDEDVKVINISQNTSRLIGFAASKGNKNAINHLENAAKIAGDGLERIINQGNEFVICVAAGNSNAISYYKDKKATYGYRENRLSFWDIFNKKKGGSEAKYNNFLNLIDIEAVKDRIIVVGSIGINADKSTSKETRYKYSHFSNIGKRVDVVGPGENIYSCKIDTYKPDSGTSMATPHVSGVAGLIFAGNPELSGAEVKSILLASTTGRFYYKDGYSGLVNAEMAVKNALATRDHSVNRVIKLETNDGLDVCFVVDTTGSMDDDIANAKENMNKILDELAIKSENFRVALVDYRDFADRARDFDYPSKLQLDFSPSKEDITAAINALNLGDGGDSNETVYSGLMEATKLKWRPQAQKIIIVLGDAPPLDPEPYTGYTLSSVTAALYNADISLVAETSVGVEASGFEHLIGDAEDSLIKVFSIGTDASDSAASFFREISEATGGSYTGVDSAAEVSDAIISTIEQIEIIPRKTIDLEFGEDYSEETVELYLGGKFVFELKLDEEGEQKLENMELDRYRWSIPRLQASGAFRIKENSESVKLSFDEPPWYSFAVVLWQRNRTAVIGYGALGIIALVALTVTIKKLRYRKNRT